MSQSSSNNYNNPKHQRQQTWVHPLETIGDYIVIENLRDTIEDFKTEKDIEIDITHYAYAKLGIGEDKKQQHRIRDLMREIEKQDVMLLNN